MRRQNAISYLKQSYVLHVERIASRKTYWKELETLKAGQTCQQDAEDQPEETPEETPEQKSLHLKPSQSIT